MTSLPGLRRWSRLPARREVLQTTTDAREQNNTDPYIVCRRASKKRSRTTAGASIFVPVTMTQCSERVVMFPAIVCKTATSIVKNVNRVVVNNIVKLQLLILTKSYGRPKFTGEKDIDSDVICRIITSTAEEYRIEYITHRLLTFDSDLLHYSLYFLSHCINIIHCIFTFICIFICTDFSAHLGL